MSTSFILITHDIATSSELADRAAVMYAGQIVEVSDSHTFYTRPYHPYSAMLMASVPRLRGSEVPEFITGQPPSLINPPTGCRFAARCPKRFARCDEEPPVVQQGTSMVKCWLYTWMVNNDDRKKVQDYLSAVKNQNPAMERSSVQDLHAWFELRKFGFACHTSMPWMASA